jgi:hypothetical protein
MSSEQTMPDGIDATMQQVELAAFDPRVDSPAPDTATQQLPPRNQPVLRGGEIRNQAVDPCPSRTRGGFFIPQLNNTPRVGHRADRGQKTRTDGAQIGATPTRPSTARPSQAPKKRPQPAVAASGFDPFK